MNSAQRLIDIISSIKTTKNYFQTVRTLFKIEDKYEQLMVYRYFLSDVKNIKTILQEKKKFKPIHQNKLSLVANFISPNFQEHSIGAYNSIIEDLELIEGSLEDEILYDKDIEMLRLSLMNIEKTNTVLDGIVSDIQELVNYYGYFGKNILEDKANVIICKSFINKEQIKQLTIKYSKHVKIIADFFSFYQKSKNTYNDVKSLANELGILFLNESVESSDEE
jgi:hypothetical protein